MSFQSNRTLFSTFSFFPFRGAEWDQIQILKITTCLMKILNFSPSDTGMATLGHRLL